MQSTYTLNVNKGDLLIATASPYANYLISNISGLAEVVRFHPQSGTNKENIEIYRATTTAITFTIATGYFGIVRPQ